MTSTIQNTIVSASVIATRPAKMATLRGMAACSLTAKLTGAPKARPVERVVGPGEEGADREQTLGSAERATLRQEQSWLLMRRPTRAPMLTHGPRARNHPCVEGGLARRAPMTDTQTPVLWMRRRDCANASSHDNRRIAR